MFDAELYNTLRLDYNVNQSRLAIAEVLRGVEGGDGNRRAACRVWIRDLSSVFCRVQNGYK